MSPLQESSDDNASDNEEIESEIVTDPDVVKNKLDLHEYRLEVCKKLGRKSSEVWNFFKKVKDVASNKFLDFVRCNQCKKILKYKKTSGTKYLWDHAKRCNKNAVVPRRGGISETNRMLPVQPADVKKLITVRIAEWCAKDLRAFATIDGKGFRAFCQTLLEVSASGINVDDILPSSRTVSRTVTTLYNQLLVEIIPEVKTAIEAGKHNIYFYRYVNRIYFYHQLSLLIFIKI